MACGRRRGLQATRPTPPAKRPVAQGAEPVGCAGQGGGLKPPRPPSRGSTARPKGRFCGLDTGFKVQYNGC